jgi:hypothetical protein
MPAGDSWQEARRTDVVNGITAVDVQTRDPDKTAARWGEITAHEVIDRALYLDRAMVTFVEGPVDSLVGVALAATDPSRAGDQCTICGVRFTLT